MVILYLDVSMIWLAFFLWFYGGYLVLTFGCPDGENELEYFGKVLAAVIIDETIGKRGGKHEHP